MNKIIYRCLTVSFIICFVTVITAQIMLRIPFVGGILPASGVAKYEEIKNPAGRILVRLKEGYQPNSNIKILVNGMEAASLASESIELSVMNNSVIEIDGRRVNYPFEVNITPVDESVICDGNFAAVDGGITKLSRVFYLSNN